MMREELILALCHEAGDDMRDKQDMLEDYRSNHSACCVACTEDEPSLLALAAAGDVGALAHIRTCAGLPLFS